MFEKIAVVRHGLATLNGPQGGKLSDEGKDQARLLAPELSTFFGYSITQTILVSSLASRAWEFSQILTSFLKVKQIIQDEMIGDSHGFVDKVEIVLPQLQRYLAYPYLIFISHESFTSDVMEHLGADPNRLNKKQGWRTMFYQLQPGQAFAFHKQSGDVFLYP